MEQMRRRRIEDGEQPQGVGAFDPEEPTTITVAWGEEVYSPVQYQSFRSGSIGVTVTTRPGEPVQAAHRRALSLLRDISKAQFEEQLAAFIERVKVAANAARGGR